MKNKESEFGKGLTYCLGLFLAHADKYANDKRKHSEIKEKSNRKLSLLDLLPGIWFNAASDHLYELTIPTKFPKKLKDRLKEFQDKVLDFGHGLGLMNDNVKESDVHSAIREAKDLLMEIDKQLGVKVIKGSYE